MNRRILIQTTGFFVLEILLNIEVLLWVKRNFSSISSRITTWMNIGKMFKPTVLHIATTPSPIKNLFIKFNEFIIEFEKYD